jgi:hypothetical protein
MEPLTRELLPPHTHYLCPLSSTEFVEPQPLPHTPASKQNSWVRHYTDVRQVRNRVEHHHIHQDCQNMSPNLAERNKHLWSENTGKVIHLYIDRKLFLHVLAIIFRGHKYEYILKGSVNCKW